MESIAWRMFPHAGLEMELSPACKLVLRNRGDFIILREIFIDQVYGRFLDAIGPVRNWVDLGCNCGMFSLYLREHARKRGELDILEQGLLVDANEEALSSATEALTRSGCLDQCRLVHGAVAARGLREAVFYEGKTSHKSSLKPLGSRGRRVVRPVVDLDAETEYLGKEIDLIKIDIEGGETHVLSDWTSFLKRGKHLVFEWHEPMISGETLDRRLEEFGFRWVTGDDGAGKGEVLEKGTGTALWSRVQSA